MTLEVSLISAGAVFLLVLLLLVVISGQRDTHLRGKDKVGESTGICLYLQCGQVSCFRLMLVFLDTSRGRIWTFAASMSVSPLLLIPLHPRTPQPVSHWQHDGADPRSHAYSPHQFGTKIWKHLPPQMWKHK